MKGNEESPERMLNEIEASILSELKIMVIDTDPGPQDPVLWLQYTNTHGLQKSCGGKGMAWPLSK